MAKERMPLFGSIPAEFPSDYSFEESVARLQALLQRANGWLARFTFRAVGKVAGKTVRLASWGPTGPSGPEFKGEFEVRDDRVALVGGFTLPLVFRALFLTYEILLGLATIGCLVAWLAGNDTAGLVALFLPVGALLLLLLMYPGRRFVFAEIPWLAAVIARELSTDPVKANQPLPVPGAARFCTVDCQVLLGLMFAMCGVSAITGVRAIYGDEQQNVHVVMYEVSGRLVVAMVAIVAAVALVGLYRRTLFVWKCGLVGIPIFGAAVLLGLISWTAAVPPPELEPPLDSAAAVWGVVVCFGVLIGLITASRTIRWYLQREYFLLEPGQTSH